jgi:predicted Rossmann-fold nucleotide-binding protein
VGVAVNEKESELFNAVKARLKTAKHVTLSGTTGGIMDAVAEEFAKQGHRVSLVEFEYVIYPKGA